MVVVPVALRELVVAPAPARVSVARIQKVRSLLMTVHPCAWYWDFSAEVSSDVPPMSITSLMNVVARASGAAAPFSGIRDSDGGAAA